VTVRELVDEREDIEDCAGEAMSKQRGKPEQRERQAAPGQHDKTPQRKSIAGGRWRSGPHKTADRKRAVRRIDNLGRDDLDETPDY